MPMYSEGKTTGASVKASIDLSPQDLLRIGGEYQQYRLDDWWTASGGGMGPNSFWNVKDGKRDRTALFGEWEKRFGAHWLTLLGLRYERVSTDADPVHGYNLATFPTSPVPAGSGNQTRDAANLNNADRDRTDNNWDLTALVRYTATRRRTSNSALHARCARRTSTSATPGPPGRWRR
jgi:iron complex outermembrane receptor protein